MITAEKFLEWEQVGMIGSTVFVHLGCEATKFPLLNSFDDFLHYILMNKITAFNKII